MTVWLCRQVFLPVATPHQLGQTVDHPRCLVSGRDRLEPGATLERELLPLKVHGCKSQRLFSMIAQIVAQSEDVQHDLASPAMSKLAVGDRIHGA